MIEILKIYLNNKLYIIYIYVCWSNTRFLSLNINNLLLKYIFLISIINYNLIVFN